MRGWESDGFLVSGFSFLEQTQILRGFGSVSFAHKPPTIFG
jgi:hypothetical protein